MKNLLILGIAAVMFLAAGNFLCAAEQAGIIYADGTVYLPGECPPGASSLLKVKLIWEDVQVSDGGTGRKIEEEADFTEKQCGSRLEFTGVRIKPFFPRGTVSVDAVCEIRKDNKTIREFIMDKADNNNPGAMSYEEAVRGRLKKLNIKLKSTEDTL